VFGGIWTTLELSSDFTTAVPAGNRIKVVGGNLSPDKPALTPADAPQVAVLPLGGELHPRNSSNSSRYTSYWSVEMISGSMKFETVADLEWYVYVALLDDSTIKALTWLTETYVKHFRATKTDHDVVDRRSLHAPKGWRSLWVGRCDMWFGTSTLLA
jgi:hypothetical protein